MGLRGPCVFVVELENDRDWNAPMTDTDDDAPQTATYISILILEAAIILLLWALDRVYGFR